MHKLNRRDTLRWGSLSAMGFGLIDWLRLSAQGAIAPRATAKSCILIWLDGGPSHLETFDLKPDAPLEVRGPFRAIPTNVPGIQLCEHLAQTAHIADRVAIVRSVTSPLGEHGLAHHYLMTGYKPTPVLEYPSLGSVVAQQRPPATTLPSYVTIPEVRSGGAGYLGANFDPFATGGDPARNNYQVRGLAAFPDVTAERIARRQAYLKEIEAVQRQIEDQPVSSGSAIDPVMEQAFRLLTSPSAKAAFDLQAESASVRDRYGRRMLGQSCLLARRLVERGVPFVSIGNTGWDTHDNLVLQLRDGYSGAKQGVGLLPMFDQAFSALIGDLADRRLLDETLVVVMGEFGRTPKLNPRGGRDHWPGVFSVVLAGGGVRGGQVIGQSDKVGERPADRPVTPADVACSIYSLLGIDPATSLTTADGRPVAINRDGQAIVELG